MSEYSSNEGCSSNGSQIWFASTTSTGSDIVITLPEISHNTPQQYTIVNQGDEVIIERKGRTV